MAMQLFVSLAIENAQVHPLRMEIDTAVELMLLFVKSHHRPPVLAWGSNKTNGTQRKASGVQGAAMSPLLADTTSAKSC
jgi:hypothetical protein